MTKWLLSTEFLMSCTHFPKIHVDIFNAVVNFVTSTGNGKYFVPRVYYVDRPTDKTVGQKMLMSIITDGCFCFSVKPFSYIGPDGSLQ